jgi:mRNA interferase RelE/StbE
MRVVEVVLTEPAERQLHELPSVIVDRMARLFDRLTNWPNVSGARPLSGDLAGRWRLRTGDYRLQFRVEGERVIVERIGHRDGFYDD